MLRDGFMVAGLRKMYAFDAHDSASMLRLADRTSLVVIDEAHQAIAPTYASILSALYTKRPNTALLGLTATPGRTWSDITEDQKLSDFFDNRKVTLEVEGYADPVTFLIKEGYLAQPSMSLVLYSQMVGRATRGPKAGGNKKAEIVTVIDQHLPGFDSMATAFKNWEDVWHDPT